MYMKTGEVKFSYTYMYINVTIFTQFGNSFNWKGKKMFSRKHEMHFLYIFSEINFFSYFS